MTGELYWNRTGRVACKLHVPPLFGDRWRLEDWRQMTADEISSLPSASLDPVHPEQPWCDECRRPSPAPYPRDWPRCPACGDHALDGHITCGRVECDEGGRRP